jgi:hypothetical protein
MRIRFCLVLLPMVLVGCGDDGPGMPTTPTPVQVPQQAVTAAFTDPAPGAVLSSPSVLLKGTYGPATLTEEIFPIVFPEKAGGDHGWPQPSSAADGTPARKDSASLTWSVVGNFGGPAQTYNIELYTAPWRENRSRKSSSLRPALSFGPLSSRSGVPSCRG